MEAPPSGSLTQLMHMLMHMHSLSQDQRVLSTVLTLEGR